jgi:hypothetical protein
MAGIAWQDIEARIAYACSVANGGRIATVLRYTSEQLENEFPNLN